MTTEHPEDRVQKEALVRYCYPTAVILPIKDYKKMLSVLEEVEDRRESKILSQSAEFKKLVKRGLEDIKAGRIKPWKEAR